MWEIFVSFVSFVVKHAIFMPASFSQSTIDVQPEALLVTAAAHVTSAELNAALAAVDLCLPIEPLQPGLTLAELVARNAGGRRSLRYGTVARYLRGATAESAGQLLALGGPTLKRATGYGVQRALVGGWLTFDKLIDVTLHIRPLPPVRAPLLLTCPDIHVACDLARRILAARLELAALAFVDAPGTTAGQPAAPHAVLLLAELEGAAAVVQRQTAQLTALAHEQGATIVSAEASPWQPWEALTDQPDGSLRLSLTLPRAQLAPVIAQARTIAQRYGLTLRSWGDAGVGTLHLDLHGAAAAGEITQAATLIYDAARRLGGALCTELGLSPLAETLWQRIAPKSQIPNPKSQIPNPQLLIPRLQQIVGAQHVLTQAEDLGSYAKDASIAQAGGTPLAVVLPASTAEISAVLRLAADAGVPVVTRGAGSGLAGGATPTEGALLLPLTRMQRLSVDAAQMTARAEAGVVTADLQRAAAAHGLSYPPDPSSQGVSTIGGNIACNAGGPRCLKYGVTADYVLGLTAVLADGTVIEVGDGLVAPSPDAGLLHLLIGSEGTLAVITEATLRLIPQPATRRTAMAIFERLDDACAAVEAIMAAGIVPASLEIMDDATIGVVEDYLQIGLPRDAEALLLLLSDGEPEAVAEETAHLAELARRGGARTVQVAQTAVEEAGLWQARRAIAPALARLRPNRLGEDICVPLPQIARTVRQIKEIATEYGQPIAVFGHAGDGNLHPNILFDARDPAQVEHTWQAAEAIFRLALERGGTLSGEHGIGTLKRAFLAAALGAEVLALQQAIKANFDPDGRLNPGKVLP